MKITTSFALLALMLACTSATYADMFGSGPNTFMAHLKKSDTQQRKYNPRRSAGRLAMDCSFRRVRRLSSSLVFA